MIYHLRNVRYWADFLQKAAISVARRLGVAVPQSSMALGTSFQCSAVACRRFRHLFGYLLGPV